MGKQYRKQLEQQLGISLAYFLRKTDEKAASEMVKPIRSAAKELARKFVKIQEAQAKAKKAAEAKKKETVKKSATVVKSSPKKASKKAATPRKAVRKTAARKRK